MINALRVNIVIIRSHNRSRTIRQKRNATSNAIGETKKSSDSTADFALQLADKFVEKGAKVARIEKEIATIPNTVVKPSEKLHGRASAGTTNLTKIFRN